MTRKVGNSLVGARLVAIRVADHGARVVRHDQRKRPASTVLAVA